MTTRFSLLLVCLVSTGCGFAQDGLAANGPGLAPETPGVRRTADVDARAYAGYAAAVVLHERSDFIRDELRVRAVVD
ncbi:MAG TPA: hypothetical protein VMX57_04045, partial [Planctomycetota bacterium]|nr:hypothetical protein [Planctomycetota bacterium]